MCRGRLGLTLTCVRYQIQSAPGVFSMHDAAALDREPNSVQDRMIAGSQWYVAQTHPRAEAKAAEHLDRQGFHVYLPNFRKRRRHARRVETVTAPLFPRYLFVSVDMAT